MTIRDSRILTRCPALRRVGAVACQHHEALDGSGFHAGIDGTAISQSARVLATVIRFQEASEAGGADKSSDLHLKKLAGDRRVDRDCLSALARELGARPVEAPKREGWPSGLTDREVEVLRLLATGLNIKRIAQHLVISNHTARHHVENIYSKAGVASRAGAVMFAVDNQIVR